MELQFDLKGYITPYKKIKIGLTQFEETFVNAFGQESTRHFLFENYKRFITDFARLITPEFTHWINGSFTTQKNNPNDIDFVTLIDCDTFFIKEKDIIEKFRLKGAKETYNVDAYTAQIYPEGHKKHFLTKSDLAYWYNWFSRTKKNRHKKTYQKGFIEIKFTEDDYRSKNYSDK